MNTAQKMSDEGIKAFGEFADKEMFVIPLDKLQKGWNVKTNFHNALNCFTPMALNVPAGWYAEILVNPCKQFSFTHMNVLKQILRQATGRAMNLTPGVYSGYIVAIETIIYEFALLWDAAIERFELEYAVAPDKEVHLVDISGFTGSANAVDPTPIEEA